MCSCVLIAHFLPSLTTAIDARFGSFIVVVAVFVLITRVSSDHRGAAPFVALGTTLSTTIVALGAVNATADLDLVIGAVDLNEDAVSFIYVCREKAKTYRSRLL